MATKKAPAKKRVSKKKNQTDPGIFAGIAFALFLIALLLYLINGPVIIDEKGTPLAEEVAQAIRYTVLGWTLLLSFLIGLVSIGGAYAIAMKDGKIEENETRKSLTLVLSAFFGIAAALLFCAWISTKAFDFMRMYIQIITAFVFFASIVVGIVVYLINHKKGDSKTAFVLAGVLLLIIVLAGFKTLNRGHEILTNIPNTTSDTSSSKGSASAINDTIRRTVVLDTVIKKVTIEEKEEKKITVKPLPRDWEEILQEQKARAEGNPQGYVY